MKLLQNCCVDGAPVLVVAAVMMFILFYINIALKIKFL